MVWLLMLVALGPRFAAAEEAGAGGSASVEKRAAPGDKTLGLFVGAGFLASPGQAGGGFELGLRLGLGRWAALGFDVGYGLLGAAPAVQDRWWLMPTAALVIPAGRLKVDLGAGLGLGASSGYTTWSAYVKGPFDPVWAFQLVPAIRGHAAVSLELTRRTAVFARLDVASLLLMGSTIGYRNGNAGAGPTDTLWIGLWVGALIRLL